MKILKINYTPWFLIVVFVGCANKTYTYYKYKEPEFSKKNYLYDLKQEKNIITFKNSNVGVIKFSNKEEGLIKNFSKKYIINNFRNLNYLKIKNIHYYSLYNKKPYYLDNFNNKKYLKNGTNTNWRKEVKFKSYKEISFVNNKRILNLNKIKEKNEEIENRIEKTNFVLNFFSNLKTAVLNLILVPFENVIEKEYSSKTIYKKQNLNKDKKYFDFK